MHETPLDPNSSLLGGLFVLLTEAGGVAQRQQPMPWVFLWTLCLGGVCAVFSWVPRPPRNTWLITCPLSLLSSRDRWTEVAEPPVQCSVPCVFPFISSLKRQACISSSYCPGGCSLIKRVYRLATDLFAAEITLNAHAFDKYVCM